MIQETNQIQKVDFHHIVPVVLHHFQFQDHLEIHILDMIIVLENSALTELPHAPDKLNFIYND